MMIVDMPIGTDLVDRAVLYERLEQWHDAAYDAVTLAFLHEVKMLIGSAPHIKAVELVRCEKCRWACLAPARQTATCMRRRLPVTHDYNFFCADGERKDGESDA